jgi:phospholipase C
MTKFYEDAAAEPGLFPEFSLIEPAYIPPGANDDHPPHDIQAGETLLAHVYNAIRANERLWNESLLVIFFDEHGGFYDHEQPIPLQPPDSRHGDGFDFKISGIRVPAILVSPWVNADVTSTAFDHTSLLKYLIDKWQLGYLGNRTATANAFSGVFRPTIRADANIPAVIDAPVQLAESSPAMPEKLNRNQAAMVALSHALESIGGGDPATVVARSQHMLSGRQPQLDVAMDRLESFIEQRMRKSTARS